MSERTKKIILIILFSTVVVGAGVVIYYLFFRPPVTPTPVAIPENVIPGLPTAGTGAPQPGAGVIPTTPEGGVLPVAPGGGAVPTVPTAAPYQAPGAQPPAKTFALTQQPVQAISVSQSGTGVRTYNPQDGKFYRVTDDGAMIPLSDNVFYSVSNVTWANRTDKAVLEYPDGSKTLYDFNNDKQVTLPKYWEDFNFSPQDNQIAAKSIGNNETSRFLVISNPDGTNARPVADLGENWDKVHTSWSPNNQVIGYSFTGDPIGMDRQSVLLIGKNQENYKDLVVEGRGFIPKWSPSGNNLLYSVYSTENDYKPMLWVSGAVGDAINAHRQNIGIQTWADKCAWQTEQVLICAVPDQIPSGAALQREALMGNTADSIVRVDLSSGTRVNLGHPTGNPTVNQMSLSADGQYAYYTDRSTGNLMRFSLTP